MITIRKSQNADSRTADHKVTEDELLKNSKQHIQDVYQVMHWLSELLIERGNYHDWTKIAYNKEFHHDFEQSQDGFQGDFKQQHWFKDLHLLERHHLTDRCPDDVNLIDVIERIVDCVTAGMARSGTIYEDNLSPEIIMKAYKNTWDMVKNNIQVKD